MAEKEEEIVLNLERQSIRGRACPRCGGKIIPSNQAVYQSTGAPEEVMPLWQCERCGYLEIAEKPRAAPKHAPKPAAKPTPKKEESTEE
jgi:ribosomal protein S27AE